MSTNSRAQLFRFGRIFLLALVPATAIDPTSKALWIGAGVAALETAFKQAFPTNAAMAAKIAHAVGAGAPQVAAAMEKIAPALAPEIKAAEPVIAQVATEITQPGGAALKTLVREWSRHGTRERQGSDQWSTDPDLLVTAHSHGSDPIRRL